MIVDLFDRLVDRIIQLLKYRAQQRKDMLEYCVTPIYIEFEKVHNQYLESFENYRNLLRSNGGQLNKHNPVLDKIRKDNLFTQDKRTKVWWLANATEEQLLSPFISSISMYLFKTEYVNSDELYQIHRTTLLDLLDIIVEERWVDVAMEILSKYEEKSLRVKIYFDENAGKIAPNLPDGKSLWEQDEKMALELFVTGLCYSYDIELTNKERISTLKAHLAVDALDSIVQDMQNLYSSVTQEYLKLRNELSG